MRKRTIRNLFRRRLPTRPLNSAAGDGKRHGPHVSYDPFGWDQECASSVLPNRRNAGAGRGEPAATGSEAYIPDPSACLDPEGGVKAFLYRNPFCHTHRGPAEAAAAPRRGRDGAYKRKKGREKSSMPDLIRRQTFRTLKLSAGFIQRFGRETRFTVPGIEPFSQLRNH